MESWREDHINSLLEIQSEQELFDQVARIAKAMGFEYCAYGVGCRYLFHDRNSHFLIIIHLSGKPFIKPANSFMLILPLSMA